MVDFRKRLKKKNGEKKVNPIEIYNLLDRKSDAGPLRPAQNEILNKWFKERYEEKDVIVKLHTGQGKTLIGLLMLQSRLNKNSQSCIYLCPNKYLAAQTIQQAEKFGIKNCEIDEYNRLPDEFTNGEVILITHIQKLFNGKSIFGIDGQSTPVDTILLDDSHACIDSIKQSFTISVKYDSEVYKSLIILFEDDLIDQGEGTFIDISNQRYHAYLPVPYWAWNDKKSEVLKILSNNLDKNEVTFVWPILKDEIENYQCLISGHGLEISPYFSPVHKFGSFHKAKKRILMSATTQNDSFFINGLGLNAKAIKNPIMFSSEKWAGEKMILVPSLIDESLSRERIVPKMSKPRKTSDFGVVALVTSFKASELYKVNGANISLSKNIFENIDKLKNGERDKTIVFVNRYDGIDLPDGACRILIVDQKPFSDMLYERYEEDCREDSEIISIKLAQKIEQGLGRSVRSEKDYCVIIILGNDLVRFIKSIKTNKYFSDQTKHQLEIGMEIANISKEELSEEKEALDILKDLINQSIKRDEGWKDFYVEKMNELKVNSREDKTEVLALFELEKKSEEANYFKNFNEASKIIQEIIDKKCSNDSEKGWYLQKLARYKYSLSKSESNQIQKAAFKSNYQLLKPKEGISYAKLNYINENRINRIKKWVKSEKTFDELMLSLNDTLSNLIFGINFEKFEQSLKILGEALGFISQRPDKEFRTGPDNLWCGIDNKFIFFECKNEVNSDRDEIHKSEASQMNTHCGWFDNNYGTNTIVKRILVIPTKKLATSAYFTHEVKIMRKEMMQNLKKNALDFFKEFNGYNISDLTSDKINQWLINHNLDMDSLFSKYGEIPVQNMKKKKK